MGSITFYAARNMAATQTWYGSVTGATSTQLTISNGYNTGVYYGSFTYVGSNVYGTLTGFAEYAGSSLLVSASGFSVNANAAANYINANLIQNFFALALSGQDTIKGSDQTDVLFGYDGNDIFTSTFGSDVIDGGNGEDLVSYKLAPGWVDVDLKLGTVSGALGNQTLRDIEDIVGSDFGEFLKGDAKNNLIFGSGGNDIIRGEEGDDILFGDDGLDSVDYATAAGPVTVNLASKISSGAAERDQIYGFEKIFASLFDDILIGDALDNYFYPLLGNDTVDGGLGIDTVIYLKGPRSDFLITGTAAELTVIGNEGTDILRNVEYVQFGDSPALPTNSLLPSYDIVSLLSAVDEGVTASFLLTTTNITAGTQLSYSLSGVSAADVQGGTLTGSITVGTDGRGTASIFILADNLTEGTETLRISVAGKLASVIINDTSRGANNTIMGTSVSDKFVASPGSNVIDGGPGVDSVQYASSRSAVSVIYKNGIITVSKADGTDTITNVERLDFTNGDLIYDITNPNAPAAYRLYGGAFDRTPDEGGFRYWADTLDAGVSMNVIAASFIAGAEFQSRYGANLSNAAFVDALYQNVLHRPGEAAGVAYWNDVLDKNLAARHDVLVSFTQLPEFVGISAANIDNGYWVV
jgi:hypothetical protein